MHRFYRGLLSAAALAALWRPAGAAIIGTTEVVASSSASFTFQGTTYNAGGPPVTGITMASSQALAGNNNTPEARNAARVSSGEIAANARLDGKQFFSDTNIQDNSSILTYTTTIQQVSGPADHIMMRFFLPPSYVETTTNAEVPFTSVSPAIFASITSGPCSSLTSCGPAAEQFDFQAYLDSTHRQSSHLAHATGQPGLDVSPLLNPTLTDSGAMGFLRTVNLDFPAFAGTLDLGNLGAGDIMRVTYRMEARATGSAAANIAIASINDPFFFDTDPVMAGAAAVFEAIPVPEPGSVALAAGAALGLFVRRGRGA